MGGRGRDGWWLGRCGVVVDELATGGVQRGTPLAIVVAPGTGVCLAWDSGRLAVQTTDPVSVVREVAGLDPRWTWWSARETAAPLVAARRASADLLGPRGRRPAAARPAPRGAGRGLGGRRTTCPSRRVPPAPSPTCSRLGGRGRRPGCAPTASSRGVATRRLAADSFDAALRMGRARAAGPAPPAGAAAAPGPRRRPGAAGAPPPRAAHGVLGVGRGPARRSSSSATACRSTGRGAGADRRARRPAAGGRGAGGGPARTSATSAVLRHFPGEPRRPAQPARRCATLLDPGRRRRARHPLLAARAATPARRPPSRALLELAQGRADRHDVRLRLARPRTSPRTAGCAARGAPPTAAAGRMTASGRAAQPAGRAAPGGARRARPRVRARRPRPGRAAGAGRGVRRPGAGRAPPGRTTCTPRSPPACGVRPADGQGRGARRDVRPDLRRRRARPCADMDARLPGGDGLPARAPRSTAAPAARSATYGGAAGPVLGACRRTGRGPSRGRAARGRYARNAVVQGAAAELFKAWAATVRAGPAGAAAGEIVLCLHDELLLHVPQEHADEVAAGAGRRARADGRRGGPRAARPVRRRRRRRVRAGPTRTEARSPGQVCAMSRSARTARPVAGGPPDPRRAVARGPPAPASTALPVRVVQVEDPLPS